MQITISQVDLLRELTILAAVIDRKVTIPVLAYCHVQTADDAIIATAPDLSNTLQTRVAAKLEGEGRALLPVQTLLGLIQRLDGPITIGVDGAGATVSAGGSLTRIPLAKAEDFPGIKEPEPPAISLPAGALLSMVHRTRFAMKAMPTKPYSGARCEIDGTAMRLVALDGYQLAVFTRPGGVAEPGIAFTMAEKSWGALEKWLGIEDATTEVSVGASADQAWWRTPTRSLACRLVDAEYPSYARMVPAKATISVSVSVEECVDTLRRHLIFSTAESTKVVFTLSRGELRVVTDTRVGHTEDAIAIDGFDGEAMTVAMNPRYALNALEAIGGARALLQLKDTKAIWRPANPEDQMLALISTMSV